jgi:succinate dehydrogenase flavin-adding protein (antitoxin of CptAB toxin-antitoxin module)
MAGSRSAGDGGLERIGELAVLARAVELIGAYNGGKLLRAALDRELVRWAVDHRPSDAAVEARLVGLARALRDAGHPTALADAIESMAPTVRARGVVTLADAPPAHVCRLCGELFLGEPPAACPTCEAPRLTLREHLPTWFLEPMATEAVVEALASAPVILRQALEPLAEDRLDTAPRAGEWSARQTLEHIVGVEELFAARIGRLLDEDDPDLVAWVPSSGEPPSDEATPTTGADTATLLGRYLELRERMVARLRSLAPAQWRRSGRHPEWGTISVAAQAAYFARHEASHLAQLVAATEGRVPGERRSPAASA